MVNLRVLRRNPLVGRSYLLQVAFELSLMVAHSRISLLACVVALAVCWSATAPIVGTLQATPATELLDSDEDFLPDDVEWAVMTSSSNADTDSDGLPDFVEVVQRGSPRSPNWPRPLDHEMRVVVSAPTGGDNGATAWLHVLVRFVEVAIPIDDFSVWFETPWLPGIQIPLEGVLFAAPTIESRSTLAHGTWLRVSTPLASMSLLQTLMPCSIHCSGSVQGRSIHSAVTLFDMGGTPSTIVPFDDHSFAVQTIETPVATVSQSNKVCVLDLKEVGSGPGGTVFEVTNAECTDCNELECGSGCAASIGWLLTIPGGIGVLTGN